MLTSQPAVVLLGAHYCALRSTLSQPCLLVHAFDLSCSPTSSSSCSTSTILLSFLLLLMSIIVRLYIFIPVAGTAIAAVLAHAASPFDFFIHLITIHIFIFHELIFVEKRDPLVHLLLSIIYFSCSCINYCIEFFFLICIDVVSVVQFQRRIRIRRSLHRIFIADERAFHNRHASIFHHSHLNILSGALLLIFTDISHQRVLFARKLFDSIMHLLLLLMNFGEF